MSSQCDGYYREGRAGKADYSTGFDAIPHARGRARPE